MIYIIIPVYNSETTLKRCLDSVFLQDFDNYFIVCVNDGSSDRSLNILKEYNECHKEKMVILNKSNGGLSSARNFALDYLKDKQDSFIIFLDSDDYIESNYLSTLYDSIIKTKSDVCCCSNYIVTKTSKQIDKHNHVNSELSFNSNVAIMNLFKLNNFCSYVTSKIFKLDIFKNLRFNEEVSILEDQYILYKIFYLSNKITYIPYVGYDYTMNSNSLINSRYSNKKILDYISAFKDPFEFNYSRFSKHEQKKTKKVILKEFGRIYIMFIHDYDFASEDQEEKKKRYNIKSFSNFNKSIWKSNVFSCRELLKKIAYILLGERLYCKL